MINDKIFFYNFTVAIYVPFVAVSSAHSFIDRIAYESWQNEQMKNEKETLRSVIYQQTLYHTFH